MLILIVVENYVRSTTFIVIVIVAITSITYLAVGGKGGGKK